MVHNLANATKVVVYGQRTDTNTTWNEWHYFMDTPTSDEVAELIMCEVPFFTEIESVLSGDFVVDDELFNGNVDTSIHFH
jgi:hypothetical protein